MAAKPPMTSDRSGKKAATRSASDEIRKNRKSSAPRILNSLFETDRPDGLHKRVYRSLVHAIVSGQLEKGAKLPSEPQLAEAFAVSRPVVRQAMDRLKSDGLIVSQRGSGNYVAGTEELAESRMPTALNALRQLHHMLDDLEFRQVIEPEAAFLAARRRTPSDVERIGQALRHFEQAHGKGAITHHFDFLFHEAIALATTNQRFVDAVHMLEYRPDDERIMMRHLVHFRPSGRAAAVMTEHSQVFELIKKRDADAAKTAMWNHIDSARLRLIKHMETVQQELAAPVAQGNGERKTALSEP
jgi:DNA-binding FadR family transcriptional regulator